MEHKNGIPGHFTTRYNVTKLVHFETYSSIKVAIKREKQLKKWKREWKYRVITTSNPTWQDLSKKILSQQ